MIRDDDACLTLDGLTHEGANVGVGQGLGQGRHVVERHALESDADCEFILIRCLRRM